MSPCPDGVVELRQSFRYQLLAETAGDVSLTILNAQWSDAGVYGCRVEVPGWFNDYKINTHLAMEEAPVEQLVTQVWTVSTEKLPSPPKTPEVAGQKIITVERIKSEEKLSVFLEVGNISRMGVIFFASIVIILVFIFWRTFKPQTTPQRLNTSPVENIYESVPMSE
ncbi:T-cell immunoglobulin and mucin domain-containing protein 4-like isoform X2 [Anabas testudineus]|uniref:T-cell immunoglobulin and mucin domain-containing protein 4-like isoform X2 n=1 Tax=Anabas testudineus TaxID=64144 RepID=UPI000E4592DC|nr:T-cell immunoglobulin and mucin domain-containing protein 4-like isoform X2 [Anabas testudineus]